MVRVKEFSGNTLDKAEGDDGEGAWIEERIAHFITILKLGDINIVYRYGNRNYIKYVEPAKHPHEPLYCLILSFPPDLSKEYKEEVILFLMAKIYISIFVNNFYLQPIVFKKDQKMFIENLPSVYIQDFVSAALTCVDKWVYDFMFTHFRERVPVLMHARYLILKDNVQKDILRLPGLQYAVDVFTLRLICEKHNTKSLYPQIFCLPVDTGDVWNQVCGCLAQLEYISDSHHDFGTIRYRISQVGFVVSALLRIVFNDAFVLKVFEEKNSGGTIYTWGT